MKTTHLTLPAAILAFTLSCVVAEDRKPDGDSAGRDKPDESGQTKTPLDQSNAKEDIQLAAKIRQMIVKDSSLSATAKNCQIITNDGRVTLRGPVNTAQEKDTIEAHAAMCAGKVKVESLLEIKTSK